MNTQVVLFLGEELRSSYNTFLHHTEHFCVQYDALRSYMIRKKTESVDFEGLDLNTNFSNSVTKTLDYIYQDIYSIDLIKKNEDKHIHFILVSKPIVDKFTLGFVNEIVDAIEELYQQKGYVIRTSIVVPTGNIIDFQLSSSDLSESNLKNNKVKEVQFNGITLLNDHIKNYNIYPQIIVIDNQNVNGKGINLEPKDFGIVLAYFVEVLFRNQNQVLNCWNTSYLAIGVSSIFYDIYSIRNLIDQEVKLQEIERNGYCNDVLRLPLIVKTIKELNFQINQAIQILGSSLMEIDRRIECNDLISNTLSADNENKYSHYLEFVVGTLLTLNEKQKVLSVWLNKESPLEGYSDCPNLLSLKYPIITELYQIAQKQVDNVENIDSIENDFDDNEISITPILNSSIYERIDSELTTVHNNLSIPTLDEIQLGEPEAVKKWLHMLAIVNDSNFDSKLNQALDEKKTVLEGLEKELRTEFDEKFSGIWGWLKKWFRKDEYNRDLNYLDNVQTEYNSITQKTGLIKNYKYILTYISKLEQLFVNELNKLSDESDYIEHKANQYRSSLSRIIHEQHHPLFIPITPMQVIYKEIKSLISARMDSNLINYNDLFDDINNFRSKRSIYVEAVKSDRSLFDSIYTVNVSDVVLNFIIREYLRNHKNLKDELPLDNLIKKLPQWLETHLEKTENYSIELMFKENISPFIFLNRLDKSELFSKTYGLLLSKMDDLTISSTVKKSLDQLVNANSELYDYDYPYKVLTFSVGKIENLEDCTF